MNRTIQAIEQTLAGLKPGETAAWHCAAMRTLVRFERQHGLVGQTT